MVKKKKKECILVYNIHAEAVRLLVSAIYFNVCQKIIWTDEWILEEWPEEYAINQI